LPGCTLAAQPSESVKVQELFTYGTMGHEVEAGPNAFAITFPGRIPATLIRCCGSADR
jgi:hypothetical protein